MLKLNLHGETMFSYMVVTGTRLCNVQLSLSTLLIIRGKVGSYIYMLLIHSFINDLSIHPTGMGMGDKVKEMVGQKDALKQAGINVNTMLWSDFMERANGGDLSKGAGGAEPSAGEGIAVERSGSSQSYHERLTAIYEKYQPEKVKILAELGTGARQSRKGKEGQDKHARSQHIYAFCTSIQCV